MLPIVETFYSIQGEGFNTGQAAFFVRIAGCDVCCSWCDEKISWDETNFDKRSYKEILDEIIKSQADTVVFTGGEPLRYDLNIITKKLKSFGIRTMVETSGTEKITGHWDWITLSAKRKIPPIEENFNRANELKIIIQNEKDFEWATLCEKKVSSDVVKYLQPEWSNFKVITPKIIDFIKKNTQWRLSVQVHKFLNIP